MGWFLASIFGYLLLLFVAVLVLKVAWDKWLRGWLFEDKLDAKLEDAKEEYVEQQLHKTLEETLKPRRKDGSGK